LLSAVGSDNTGALPLAAAKNNLALSTTYTTTCTVLHSCRFCGVATSFRVPTRRNPRILAIGKEFPLRSVVDQIEDRRIRIVEPIYIGVSSAPRRHLAGTSPAPRRHVAY
jgi:hypothetical protein